MNVITYSCIHGSQVSKIPVKLTINSLESHSIQCKPGISTSLLSSAMRAQTSASLADAYTIVTKSLVSKPDIKRSLYRFHSFPLNQWSQASGAASRLPVYTAWLIPLNNCILKVFPKTSYLHHKYV